MPPVVLFGCLGNALRFFVWMFSVSFVFMILVNVRLVRTLPVTQLSHCAKLCFIPFYFLQRYHPICRFTIDLHMCTGDASAGN